MTVDNKLRNRVNEKINQPFICAHCDITRVHACGLYFLIDTSGRFVYEGALCVDCGLEFPSCLNSLALKCYQVQLRESNLNSNNNHNMKRLIFSTMIMLVAAAATGQVGGPRQSANYEAANWKTVALTPYEISISAPPGNAQSKAELKSVRQRISQVDENKLKEIKYWDAGAPAYRWNQIVPMLLQRRPDVMLRLPSSWINIAIYDATILAWKEKIKHKRPLDPSLSPHIHGPSTYSYPCEHTVTAAAAATVLAYFLPEKADSIMQLARAASQSRIDAGVQFPTDVEAGWKLGEEVAKRVIEKAMNDNSNAKWTGPINTDSKKWTGKFPMGITLSLATPLVLRSADQFRPLPPPDFEKDMNELKNFKQTFKSRSSAYYWANTNDIWSTLAGQKMFEYRMSDDAPAVARIYAVLHTAYHDMAIAIFDAKYAYWGIRPSQYDTTYQPLISTPPFPGYPSGHAAGAATSCAVLEYFFPADAKEFQVLAQDCADSRFYAGIHFRTDNETALTMGRTIGKYVVETWVNQSKSVASAGPK
jgi:membrane-associated phospholipid phosphatase